MVGGGYYAVLHMKFDSSLIWFIYLVFFIAYISTETCGPSLEHVWTSKDLGVNTKHGPNL